MPAASANGHASLSHVPIIDISKPDKDTPAKLVDAAATYGFVYIKSVGLELTREIVDHVFALVCLLYFPSACHQLIRGSHVDFSSRRRLIRQVVQSLNMAIEVGLACTQKPWTRSIRRQVCPVLPIWINL